jgi:hypothetical protein
MAKKQKAPKVPTISTTKVAQVPVTTTTKTSRQQAIVVVPNLEEKGDFAHQQFLRSLAGVTPAIVVTPADGFDYWDETSQKGYSILEFIAQKRQLRLGAKTGQPGQVDALKQLMTMIGQSKKRREEMTNIDPIPELYHVDETKPTNEMIKDQLTKTGVKVFQQGALVPQLTEISQQLPGNIGGDEDFILYIPEETGDDLRYGFTNLYPPFYSASYHSVKPFVVMVLWLRDLMGSEQYRSVILQLTRLHKEMIRTLTLNYFGVRFMGQMKRLSDVVIVWRWAMHGEQHFSLKSINQRMIMRFRQHTSELLELKEDFEGAKSSEPIIELEAQIQQVDIQYSLIQRNLKLALSVGFVVQMTSDYSNAVGTIIPISSPPLHFTIALGAKLSEIELAWKLMWTEKNGVGPPFPLTSLVPTSNSGVMWRLPGNPPKFLKHKDTVYSEYAFCNRMLKRLQVNPDLTAFANAYRFLSIGLLKPKAEVYEIPGATFEGTTNPENTKTRNINGANTVAFLPLMAVHSLTYKFSPNFMEHPESRNLNNYTFYKGGMTALFRYMLNSTKVKSDSTNVKVHTLVYSDNLYLYGIKHSTEGNTLIFLSLDGVKMEATITYDGALLEIIRMLQALGLRHNGQQLQSDTLPDNWTSLLLNVMPLWISKQNCLLGKTQFLFPGMGSGVTGTSYFNGAKMATLAAELEGKVYDITQLVEEKEGVATLGPVLKALVDKFKLQLTLEVRQYLALGKSNDPNDQFQHLLANNNGQVIKMDLLGNDAFFFGAHVDRFDLNPEFHIPGPILDTGIIMPCLSRQRIVNSMLFHKFAYYDMKLNKLNDVGKTFMQVVIFRVLYLVGGFAYEDLSILLRYAIDASIKTTGVDVSLTAVEKNKIVLDVLAGMQDSSMFSSVVSMALHETFEYGLPSLATLIKLHGRLAGHLGAFSTVTPSICADLIIKNAHVRGVVNALQPIPDYAVTKMFQIDNTIQSTIATALADQYAREGFSVIENAGEIAASTESSCSALFKTPQPLEIINFRELNKTMMTQTLLLQSPIAAGQVSQRVQAMKAGLKPAGKMVGLTVNVEPTTTTTVIKPKSHISLSAQFTKELDKYFKVVDTTQTEIPSYRFTLRANESKPDEDTATQFRRLGKGILYSTFMTQALQSSVLKKHDFIRLVRLYLDFKPSLHPLVHFSVYTTLPGAGVPQISKIYESTTEVARDSKISDNVIVMPQGYKKPGVAKKKK